MAEVSEGADIGARLRRLREQRGVTLRDISADTKIAMAHLEALERRDVRRLPGGIFLRAIVRSYAQQIGLDPDDTLREFLANTAVHAGQAGPSATTNETASRRRTNLIPATVAMMILAILAIVLWSVVGSS